VEKIDEHTGEFHLYEENKKKKHSAEKKENSDERTEK